MTEETLSSICRNTWQGGNMLASSCVHVAEHIKCKPANLNGKKRRNSSIDSRLIKIGVEWHRLRSVCTRKSRLRRCHLQLLRTDSKIHWMRWEWLIESIHLKCHKRSIGWQGWNVVRRRLEFHLLMLASTRFANGNFNEEIIAERLQLRAEWEVKTHWTVNAECRLTATWI